MPKRTTERRASAGVVTVLALLAVGLVTMLIVVDRAGRSRRRRCASRGRCGRARRRARG